MRSASASAPPFIPLSKGHGASGAQSSGAGLLTIAVISQRRERITPQHQWLDSKNVLSHLFQPSDAMYGNPKSMAWRIAVQFPNDVSSYCTSEDRFVPENMDAEEKKDSQSRAS